MPASFYTVDPRYSTTYNTKYTSHPSRAGAPNIAPHDKATSPNHPVSATTSSARFHNRSIDHSRHAGRNDTGDVFYSSSEWAIFSFDEELERQLRHEKEAAPIFYVGRGGTRNIVHPGEYSFTRKRSETSSIGSNSATDSESDRATDTTRRNNGKGWGKYVGLSS